MKNCETSNAPDVGEAQVDLHKEIKDLFCYCGTAKDMEKVLWDMLQSSISNPEQPTEPKENSERLFLYKRLAEFLAAIEPEKSAPATTINFTNN
jgi:hypothetical protein